MGYADCRDVLDRWVKVKDRSELFNTQPGQVAYLLLGASYVIGFDRSLDVLIKSKSMEDLEKNGEILKAFETYDAAFKDGLKEFENNADAHGNIIFSVIKPRYKRLGSPIINEISFKNPDNAIFLFEQTGGKYKVSVRYQKGNVHMGELMARCCNGGGHRSAAGGTIKPGELGAFKNRVIEELEGKV